jgi:hypothetical protein
MGTVIQAFFGKGWTQADRELLAGHAPHLAIDEWETDDGEACAAFYRQGARWPVYFVSKLRTTYIVSDEELTVIAKGRSLTEVLAAVRATPGCSCPSLGRNHLTVI